MSTTTVEAVSKAGKKKREATLSHEPLTISKSDNELQFRLYVGDGDVDFGNANLDTSVDSYQGGNTGLEIELCRKVVYVEPVRGK